MIQNKNQIWTEDPLLQSMARPEHRPTAKHTTKIVVTPDKADVCYLRRHFVACVIWEGILKMFAHCRRQCNHSWNSTQHKNNRHTFKTHCDTRLVVFCQYVFQQEVRCNGGICTCQQQGVHLSAILQENGIHSLVIWHHFGLSIKELVKTMWRYKKYTSCCLIVQMINLCHGSSDIWLFLVKKLSSFTSPLANWRALYARFVFT